MEKESIIYTTEVSSITSHNMSQADASMVTTSFILSNLHCPSCVSHIQNTLYALIPRPTSVSASLVSSVVTVLHDAVLPATDIQDALENVGFEIFDVAPASRPGTRPPSMGFDGISYSLDRFADRIASEHSSRRQSKTKHWSKHVQNCEACRHEAAGGSGGQAADTKTIPQVDGNDNAKDQPTTQHTLVAIESSDIQPPPKLWRASLAVGGMTCAACAGSITKELEKKDWVKAVAVNLISNSATIEFVGEEHKNEIVSSIEDIGFDATIDSVVNTNEPTSTLHDTRRTVEIRVDGMFCEHCPPRVLASLVEFRDKLEFESSLSLDDPVLEVSYTPQTPDFTIRSIIAAIAAVDSNLRPSVYHPPTLEERSRQLHEREQWRILIRVVLTFIIAIPTLIIGIVYMSLLPSNNPGRCYLMKPLIAGISRAQWALFILATPVYFLCADVFHLRAIKELRSMWRRGSTTPILQRFYRFGSMNMLMSLGTSIAYISSVAQLIAAGIHPLESTPIEHGELLDAVKLLPARLVPATAELHLCRIMDESASVLYFDSVVFLTLFLLVGRLIEAYSKSRTGDAVTMLGKLRPTEALLVESGSESSLPETITGEELANGDRREHTKSINVDLLEFGDVVKVLHGASPPCDGSIIQGESRFDESSLTGETKLVKKRADDEVFSGTVNKGPPVSIRITGVAGSSMLDQIVKAVRDGQTRRAPMERIADTLTGYFVPFITMIGIATWLMWLSLGYAKVLPDEYRNVNTESWVVWSLQFAIAVFVVACPCGLALAAPTALFVGGGMAAKYGILVKGGGEAFEKASKLDCVVFDKTGTLTIGGEPTVTDSEVLSVDIGTHNEATPVPILGMIKSLEENSSHPIAKALVGHCKSQDSISIDVQKVEEIAGKGMSGTFYFASTDAEVEMIMGNESLLSHYGVPIPGHCQSSLEKWKIDGKSVALAAVKANHSSTISTPGVWHLAAMFAISDPIRPEAPGIIRALREMNKDVWMLSGDNQMTANAIGHLVGIPAPNIIAGVLPSEKADKIRYLQRSLKARTASGKEHSHRRAMIAMVGDGINDSPALTTADVGIAIGSGSDIAISSAEFVLVSSNLISLITLLDLSKFVFRRIKFNFAWALVYNMVALPVAAGVLYPIKSHGKHIHLDPVWASLAMALSSISVVCSSLALRSRLPWVGFQDREAKKCEESYWSRTS